MRALIVAIKGQGKSDGVVIGGFRLENPKQGASPPHDLVHAVVERELGLNGFVHQVAAGAEPRAAESTIAAFQAESVVEALQAEIWGGRAASDEAFWQLVAIACAQRGVPTVRPGAGDLARLRAAVQDVEERWRAARPRDGGELPLELVR